MRAQDITAGQSVQIQRSARVGTIARIIPADGYSPARVVVQFKTYQETFHAEELNLAH